MPRGMLPHERAARIAAVEDGRRRGLNVTEIARELRMKPETLRQWILMQNAPPSPRRPAVATTRRDCRRCENPFDSEGAHHRMCDYCRSYAAVMDSPFTPDPGGSTGRQVRAVRP